MIPEAERDKRLQKHANRILTQKYLSTYLKPISDEELRIWFRETWGFPEKFFDAWLIKKEKFISDIDDFEEPL